MNDTAATQNHHLYLAQALVPVEPRGVLPNHGLCVNPQGRIVDIDHRRILQTKYPRATVVDLTDSILLPGFVNAHTHAAMSLMRGLSNDVNLHRWLKDAIWPIESKLLSADFVRTGTELAVGEMLQTGTTCFADMYFFPDACGEVVDRLGIRAAIGLPFIGFATAWARTPREYLERGEKVLNQWRGHPRINFTLAPHSPYTVDDAQFAELLEWRRRIDERMPIHIHLHESAKEIADSMTRYRRRPIDRLFQLGVLEGPTLAIHMTQANDHDLDLCQRHSVAVAHCPQSNAHFANGIAPVTRMLERNLTVGLGTDGAASNNDLDLGEEMMTASLLAKIESGRADALPAEKTLWLACMGGARALGLELDIGSLSIGKWADFQAIQWRGWSAQPLNDLVRQLVYARCSHQVRGVWVAGRPVLRSGRVIHLDGDRLQRKIDAFRTRFPPSTRPSNA